MSRSRRLDRPSVLWCDPLDEAARTELEGLGLEVVVQEPTAGLSLLTSRFDAIVAQWTEAWRRALGKLDRPVMFIHLGPSVPQTLLDFVVAGGNGWAATSPRAARSRLASSLAPARWSERFPYGESTVVSLENGEVRAPLLDCSSEGLAFWLPGSTDIDRYADGLVLEGVSLERSGAVVLADAALRVRSLASMRDGFRVGCRFETGAPTSTGTAEHELKDPVRTLAVVARASRVGAIRVVTENGVQLSLPPGEVDAPARRLRTVQDVDLEPFEVVQCFAHLDDSRYDWHAAVVQGDPLTLQVPHRIDEYCRRQPVRRAPRESGLLRFTHPLSRVRHQVPVVDFTSGGARVSVRDVAEPFPAGLKLLDVELELDGASARAHAELRRHDPASGQLGLKLHPATPGDAYRLRLAWVLAGHPELSDARHLEFDHIWDFSREAGLVTPEVSHFFEPLKSRARETQRGLARDDGQIFSAVAFKDPELGGYLSAFRVYPRTWYVQHLGSTTPGAHTAVSLNRAVGELCEQTPDAHYVQLAYYVDNPWPARLFGGFVRRMERAGGVAFRLRRYQRVRTEAPGFVESPTCRPATLADTPGVLALLTACEPPLLWQAMDLDAEGLWLQSLDALYQRVGLTRRREVLVAEHQGRVAAAALCEVSSVGINFRELASVARLSFEPGLAEPLRERLGRELAAATVRHYRALGRPFVLLCADAEVPVPAGALLGPPFTLAEATGRKDLLRDFKRLGRLNSAIAGRLRRRATG